MFDCSQMLKFLLTFGSLLSVGFPRAKVPRLFTEPLLPSSAPCDGYEGTGAAAPYNTIQIRQCRTFIRIMEIKGSCFVFTQMVFVYHDCMCCIIVFFISNLMLHLLISFSTILDSEGFDSVESQQAGSTVQTLLNTREIHTSTSSLPNPGLLHLHPPPSEEVVR